MLDFPSPLYKGLRILMFQLSGVYCKLMPGQYPLLTGSRGARPWQVLEAAFGFWG